MILASRGSAVRLRHDLLPLIAAWQSNPRWELPHLSPFTFHPMDVTLIR
jgi:hypothetical protein